MGQHDGETVAQFVTRLRQVVKDCDYGEQAENQIRDQVVLLLRRKLLAKGEKLTLELLLSTAANHERVQSQLESGKNGVNAVREKQQDKTKASTSEFTKQACVHESKDGFCDYSHTSSKLSTCLESRTLLIRYRAYFKKNQNLHQHTKSQMTATVTATPRAVTTREIKKASSEDREFVELRQCIKN